MDTLLWLLTTVSQVVIGIVGFLLTLRPALADQHFALLLATFIVATVVAIGTSFWSFVRSRNSTNTVALLTEQILYEVKGSPDCILEIHADFTQSRGGDREKGICTFQYYNRSDYPMIDVTVGVCGVRWLEFPRYGRKIGDVRPTRGGTLPNLTVTLPKDKISTIEFSIDCRSVTLWQTIYFKPTEKGWISDHTIFKEVDGKEVYVRDLRPNSPFEAEVAQKKKWALEKWEEEKASEIEERAEKSRNSPKTVPTL